MILRLIAIVTALTVVNVPTTADEAQGAIKSIIPAKHRLVFNQHKADAEMQWVLSSIKKINGRWRYEESGKTTGVLLKQTYEFDQVDRQELTEKIETLAIKKQWKTVFDCEGMACGRSYGWSEIFSNKALHGIDSSQRYWVWQTPGAWYSAFIVERGNRRVYLQWLELALTENTSLGLVAKNSLIAWNNQGFAVLPTEPLAVGSNSMPLEISASDLLLLKSWLAAQPHRNYAVVGHNQQLPHIISQQDSQSLSDAQALTVELRKTLKDYSFKVYGLGPIAPRGDRSARVEIVPLYSEY